MWWKRLRRPAIAVGLALSLGLLAAASWVRHGAAEYGGVKCMVAKYPMECLDALAYFGFHDPTELRFLVPGPVHEVAFPAGDLMLRADLYEPAEGDRVPAILLVHGLSPYGRRLPLVRILAERFRRMGYVVLAPDLRGFGDSDDPADPASPESLDFGADVRGALDYLEHLPIVDPARIFVVGHSLGAGAAISEMTDGETRVRGLMLIGPPRRLGELALSPEAPNLERDRLRTAAAMHLEGEIPPQTMRAIYARLDIESHLDALRAPAHMPILLNDGEDEDPDDRDFLHAVSHQLEAIADYWSTPRADHYMRTGLILGHLAYNASVMDEFMRRAGEWLARNARDTGGLPRADADETDLVAAASVS